MLYRFESCGMYLGEYTGLSLKAIKETAAKDWGYSSWKDMVEHAHECFGYSNIQIYNERNTLVEDGQ